MRGGTCWRARLLRADALPVPSERDRAEVSQVEDLGCGVEVAHVANCRLVGQTVDVSPRGSPPGTQGTVYEELHYGHEGRPDSWNVRKLPVCPSVA